MKRWLAPLVVCSYSSFCFCLFLIFPFVFFLPVSSLLLILVCYFCLLTRMCFASALQHFTSSSTLLYFQVFTDGTTNKLVGFFDPQNASDVVLIRVNGNKTDLLIDRKKEAETIKILHAAGLAPALYGTFDNGLVYEYVPGVVLTVDTVRADTTSALVAKKMADMHRVKPENGGTTPEPALWPTINKFLSQVPETFTHPEKRRRCVLKKF